MHGTSPREPVAGWKSPASKPHLEETARRKSDSRETSAESHAALGQVFPKPRELTPREETCTGSEGGHTHSTCGKFQPYLISWGSCKIVTQRKVPNRKELEENASPLAATMAVPGISSSCGAASPASPPPAASINTQSLLRRLEGNGAKDNRVSFVMRKDYGIK